MPMRESSFNLRVKDFPTPGTTLVYNTLTGAFVELEGDGALPDDPALAEEDTGFLAPDEVTDERRFRDWYDALVRKSDTLSAIVSITQACNFDCTYCCQADVLDGRTMTAETGYQTAVWLAARAKEIGARTIEIAFMGGEPLLQPRRIEQIVERVKRDAGPDIEVRFSLITNGLFLTRELVEKWVPMGLKGAQVTLDGDEHTHSLTRRSRKGEDTFQTIFDNVVACHDLIKIAVNGNFQPDTVEGFPRLMTKLREAGLAGVTVSFTPALEALGAPEGAGSGTCTIAGSRPELMLALNDEAIRQGFAARDPQRIGPCSLHRHHTFAVDVDGHLYKCPAFVGKPEWAVGDATSGLDDRYDEILSRVGSLSGCGSCAHRPDCAGGCVAAEWIKRGSPTGRSCELDYFETHGDTLLKRSYSLQVADAEGVSPFDIVPAVPLETSTRGRGRRSAALRVVA
jgi:uncharacterized protein